jgi:hypothetical protein
MNTKGNLALAVLAGISIRGSERHDGSRAGGQNAARLSDCGNRRNRPRCLSEVRRKGSGNAGCLSGAASTMSSVAARLRLFEGQPPKIIVVLAFDSTESSRLV